jgi:hypothetical protein
MFFTFPEDARWNEDRRAVEFGVEIGEYRGVVRVTQRVFQRLLTERPTPERCVEAYYLQRTRFECIAERKLRRRQLTEDGNVERRFRRSGASDRWPLRASFADQHLHTHDQPSVMLEWCKSRPYLLAHQAAINLGEGEVHLWLRSSSCFDRVPVIIETRNHVFAYFALYSDVLEPRAGEQGFQPLPVRECE